MSNNPLVVLSEDQSTPITTSEIIARALNKEHKDVLALAQKYASELDAFGPSSFKTKMVGIGSGAQREKEYAVLNEPQATFLITLMRNSPEVVQFKVALVKAFYSMREKLHREKVNFLTKDRDEVKSKNAALTRENRVLVEKNKKLTSNLQTLREAKPTLNTKEQYELTKIVREASERMGVATAGIYKRIYDVFQVPSYRLLSVGDLDTIKKMLSNTDPMFLGRKPKAKDVEAVFNFSRPYRELLNDLNKLCSESNLYDLMDSIDLISTLYEIGHDSSRIRSILDYLKTLQTFCLTNQLRIEVLHEFFPVVDHRKNAPYVRCTTHH